jgi:hypothetical protein
MKLLKGWKTILFNGIVLAGVYWSDVETGVKGFFGTSEQLMAGLAIANILLRLITVGPVALMWISQKEQETPPTDTP